MSMEDEDATTVRVVIPPEMAGARLDRALTELVPGGLSRARIQSLMKTGHVTAADGATPGASCKVAAGEAFDVVVPAPEPAEPVAEAMSLAIVHEDEHLIVIDKPAGLVVHPAAGHSSGTLVNALLAHCGASLSGIGGVKRPGIVHRLDKDTSGLIVVAKSDRAHQGLAEQFAIHGADGRLERAYLALVWGTLRQPRMTIDAALARSMSDRTRISVSKSALARRAVTHVEALETFADAEGGPEPVATLVRATLETGRTHQIRVHLAHVGNPLLGDEVYGATHRTKIARLAEPARAALTALGRQALHATRLGFEHPLTGRKLAFDSPPPADLAAVLNALRVKSSRRR